MLRARLSPIDIGVVVAVLVLLYVVVRVGHGATASFSPHALQHVSTNPAQLPYDAVRSLLRMFVALFFSFAFTLIYGYTAARSRRAERVLVPILDILQSVPVLGFLTITVTVFVGIFPHSELGLEWAAIFAIFTAQAWNMTFSFYASLKSLPRELDELSRSLRLTKWQRFWKIEVPNGAIGLVWNGMLSFGGAWFFLVASEAITLHNRTYSLPGVGSYVGAAISKGDLGAVGFAIGAMIIMVIGVNFLFWRPLVAWSERFRYETTEAKEAPRSVVLGILARSTWPRTVGRAWGRVAEPLGRAMQILGRDGAPATVAPARQRAGDIVFGVVQPDLLLMDEPFSALDVLTAENLRTELVELWQAGEFPADAILIVTHNIEEAVIFADRVIVLGTNPGRIKTELANGLPRPRDRHNPDVGALVDEIYGIMTDRATSEALAQGAEPEAGVQQVMLPHASVDGIAGLAELVLASGGDADLGELARVLGFEIDDLFPIIDSMTILDFASVEAGHLVLTDTGKQFAGADIQQSKAIFREAVLQRVPLVRRIERALRHSTDGTLREGFFLDLLHNHYSDDESRAQLDTAIDWARYAELFEYDAAHGEIRLDQPVAESLTN